MIIGRTAAHNSTMRGPLISLKRARQLRRRMTAPEVRLWVLLRGAAHGDLRFRRQHPVGPYILDFYHPASRLAVEIDGEWHAHPEQAAHDRARDEWLQTRGARVLRLAATDVLHEEGVEGVLAAIREAAKLKAVHSIGVSL